MTQLLVLNCIKIFFGRILDVSCGTLRTVLTVKEKTIPAACIGFCEVLIWYMIVSSALNMDAPLLLVAVCYAGGYATGTYVGGKIARKFIHGHLFVDVITSSRDDATLRALRDAGFALTVMNANSSDYSQEKYLILSDIDKRDLDRFEELVKQLDPKAFIVVSEIKREIGGYIAHRK